MKFVIFYFIFNLLPVLILSKGPLKYSKEVEECRKEIKVNDDEYYTFKKNYLPTTKRGACMLACYYKKMEIITANNKLNATKLLKTIEDLKNKTRVYKTLKNVYQGCSNMSNKENDTCEVAKKYAQCSFPITKNFESRQNRMSCISNYTNLEVYYGLYNFGVPRTRNEQCLLACSLKQSHFITSDNKLDPDFIKLITKLFKKDKQGRNITGIANHCKLNERPEADECVAAKNIAECLLIKIALSIVQLKDKQDIQECRQQTNATEIETFTAFKMSHIPKTRRHSCVLACLFKRNGIMSANNTVFIEPMKKKINMMKWIFPELFKKSLTILEDCKLNLDTKLTDECEIARKFTECYLSNQNKLK